MANITIKINTDDDALSHKCDDQKCKHQFDWHGVSEILKDLAINTASNEAYITPGKQIIRDINGNTVGSFKVQTS